MKRPLLRKVLLALAIVVACLAAVPAYFVVRLTFFSPTFNVSSIRETPQYQNSGLLSRAWDLPVARTFGKRIDYQSNGSVCGPSSLVNIEHSLGAAATEDSILDGTGMCWTGACFGGLTLSELGVIARAKTGKKVTELSGLSYEQFRSHLPHFNDEGRRYVANFHRGPLFGRGGGHHSPIGGYLAAEDLVLVLDVNQEYKPWLVEPRRLFDAIDTVDESTGEKRGLLLLE